MRTTLTLDEDVARKLDDEVRRSRRSFKAVVNETLRRGLVHPAPVSKQKFAVRAQRLGLRSGLNIDGIEELLDRLDGAARS